MSDTIFHGIEAETITEALSIATANSKLKEMKLLIQDGADINGFSPLSGSTPLTNAASDNLTSSLKLLIKSGADINLPSKDMDLTPLMHACSRGKIKGSNIAKILIDENADVTYIRKTDEMTALKFAVKACTPEVVQALIDNGADIDGPEGTDQTALMLAARTNNVQNLNILIKNGANPLLQCKLKWAEGLTAEGLASMEGCLDAASYLAEVNKNA